ncbi:MAG: 50S ribosomal protein L32 [Defluviitaleaceae bacterium]|nr:50S ribosomal protein L32 [Defluviitaleaceae bacterium]
MPICPKGKISKGRRDKRRAQNYKLVSPNLNKCPSCNELILSHRACRFCGHYKKVEVMKVS